MKTLVIVINWVMLVFGVIATVALLIDARNGATGDGPGIILGFAIVIQTVLTLAYLYDVKVNLE